MLGAVAAAARPSFRVGLSRCLRPVFPRITSAGTVHTAPDPGSAKPPPKQWSLSVSPYTCIRAQLDSCSLSVSPLDLHAFPEADRALVTVHGAREGQESALDRCLVHYDGERRELRLTGAGGGGGEMSIQLQAPVKSDLFISSQGRGHVHISHMECDVCSVSTQQGDCTLQSVKAHRVEVRSSGGAVTGLGTIHGNVDIVSSGASAVDVKKLQGSTMSVATEHGSLKVKALYAQASSISSRTGNIQLGHVHGDASVRNESGDTVIDGSSSSTQVSSLSGDIDLYVGEAGSAEVFSEQGAVCVRVPASFTAVVELCGASVDISPDVAFHETQQHQAPGQTTVLGLVNGASEAEQPRVRARTTAGAVTLKSQSWFESLKLRNP